MTNSTINKIETAKKLQGSFVYFSGGAGEVTDYLVDGGDYEKNHTVFLFVQTANGERVSIDPSKVNTTDWNDYLDIVYLTYGIEL